MKKPGFWPENRSKHRCDRAFLNFPNLSLYQEPIFGTALVQSISELLGTRINQGAIAIALPIKVLP
ncbi:hypothetical protein [Microseira sp. BLCC-F43]|uniref:hypothetical protein n=1 Tax=Microseira sp. BLCC-F43 TaxID=3153602 RepID=UPI0035BB7AE1